MIVMVSDQPHWACDLCTYEVPVSGGAVLYNRAKGSRHYPQPLVVCGEACASLAEIRLVAGEIVRLPWTTFVTALNESVIDAAP